MCLAKRIGPWLLAVLVLSLWLGCSASTGGSSGQSVPARTGLFAAADMVRTVYSSAELAAITSAFTATYNKALSAGFNPGEPVNYVLGESSDKGLDGFWQDYTGGDSTAIVNSTERCVIFIAQKDSTAYLCKNDFYAYGQAHSASTVFGSPVSDEYSDSAKRYQKFLNGLMSEPLTGSSASAVTWTAYDGTSATGYLPGVVFSHLHGGASWDAPSALTVSLTSSISGASIYYTTDGSVPTSASTQYAAPIVINSSSVTTISAIAIANGYSSFPVAKRFSVTAHTSPELLSNGDFSSGFKVWYWYGYEDARLYGSISSNAAYISVQGSSAGSEWWHRQIGNCSDIELEKGGSYRVKFDAWADSARILQVVFSESGIDSDGDSNLYEWHGSSNVSIGKTKASYVWDFTMPDATDAYGWLQFNFGLDNTAFHLANVSVQKIDSSSTSASLDFSQLYGKIEVGDNGRYYLIELDNAASAWGYFDVAVAGSYSFDIVNQDGLSTLLYPQKSGDPSAPDTTAAAVNISATGVTTGHSLSAQRYFIKVATSDSSTTWDQVSFKIYE
jgi:hypothetical protein